MLGFWTLTQTLGLELILHMSDTRPGHRTLDPLGPWDRGRVHPPPLLYKLLGAPQDFGGLGLVHALCAEGDRPETVVVLTVATRRVGAEVSSWVCGLAELGLVPVPKLLGKSKCTFSTFTYLYI